MTHDSKKLVRRPGSSLGTQVPRLRGPAAIEDLRVWLMRHGVSLPARRLIRLFGGSEKKAQRRASETASMTRLGREDERLRSLLVRLNYGRQASVPVERDLADLRDLLARGPRAESQKVEKDRAGDLGSIRTPKSEGPISRKSTVSRFKDATGSKTQARALPDQPKRLWSADLRGKSKAVVKEIVEAFIEDVYGEFLPAHRDEMRDYLRRKDPKLHAFLKNYGFENLPDRFRMPSQRDRVQELIAKAASGTYKDMPLHQRRAVVGALRRPKRNPQI